MLARPVPRMFKKLLTREIRLFDALLGKLSHNLGLGGNRSMVGTRYPAGILAFHTGTAYENILNSVVEHVPHVQYTGNIWRRYHHCIRLAAIGFGTEQLVVKPVLIPFRLYFLRVVLTC